MAINTGGPAYPGPCQREQRVDINEGMSLRAWLAGTIASGCRAGKYQNAGAYPSEVTLWDSRQVARLAIRDADAIIAELERNPNEQQRHDHEPA